MQDLQAHTLPIEETAQRLESSLSAGLSSSEAERRLAQYGPNELREEPPPTLLQMLIAQFNNFVIILLIIAAVISAIVGAYTGEGYTDSIAIVAIIALNAILGVVQEGRAEAALRALKKMSAPEAHVIREGKIVNVPSRDVVPGDIVILETGNYIPADIRLIEGFNLTIDEAALTGESMPVQKRPKAILGEDATLGDRHNMAFMGSMITYGRGKGIVITTGMNTEIGTIAEMLQSYEDPPTPLQRRLDQLGRWLGWATLVISAIVFIVGVLRLLNINPIADLGAWINSAHNQEELIELFMVAVSLAIAAVPEGLPAVVTIALALGMQRMISRHVLIRKLAAVETLGSANVICSDKTGTLTTNEMTVVNVFVDGHLYHVSGEGYRPEGSFSKNGSAITNAADIPSLETLAHGAMLCNDAIIEHDPATDGWQLIGDPTEGALLTMATKAGLAKETLSSTWPRIAEVPFDSERKRMTTIHQPPNGDGQYKAFTKGAPEFVLERCTGIYENGEVHPLDDARKAAILEQNSELAGQALRVLAVAFRNIENIPEEPDAETVERDLVFVGLAAMRDPARPEVKDAIAVARNAGIRTVMITGDYPDTAAAIGSELGLLEEKTRILTGKDLNDLDDDGLFKRVEDVSVFARVNPVHKMRIVEALQKHDHIVAMTGDGVNDAPALKRAHIGVAMGITGTDVSKQTADMVLTDDNYASIVSAVEEGRVIYANIRKFVYYLISCNVGEILIIFLSMLMGLPLPLLPIHLLWLNLVTDGAPALALGLEDKEPDIMNIKPRPSQEPIITGELWLLTGIQAAVETIATLGAFIISLNVFGDDLVMAQTMAFTTLVVAELLRAFTARSERYNLWQIGAFTNKWMIYAVSASFVLLLAVIYLPFLQPVFDTVPLDLSRWAVLLPFTLLPSLAAEIAKFFLRRRHTLTPVASN